ncbi:hypothetical protein LJC38_02455 [Parabacteroides sp. OttesenSCG-928-K15]|nr:hypothetical protein [Parabacteroides sp. OttesenSCG-928-K15]
MKQVFYIIALLHLVLLFGCNTEENFPTPEKTPERRRLELSGSLQTQGITTRSYIVPDPGGMIHPIVKGDVTGLPPYQLEIGIVTTELISSPDIADWNNETTYLDRGFFGGLYPGDKPSNYTEENPGDESGDDPENDLGKIDTPVWTGKIEYTNREGTAIQHVFYDEMVEGVSYFLVAFYPYHAIYDIENVEEDENGTIIWDDELGAAVVFEVDGSQDIMASTMGAAHITNQFNTSLYFSHKLTALRCHFFAESELAASLYGAIDSVKLINQPEKIGLNIGKQADPAYRSESLFNAYPELTTDYPAVRPKDADDNPVTAPLALPSAYTSGDAVEFGYMLAMPAQTYTFSIFTSVRGAKNPVYATYTFPDDLPAAGTVHNLTFKMLETAEIQLVAANATEWTFVQTFD